MDIHAATCPTIASLSVFTAALLTIASNSFRSTGKEVVIVTSVFVFEPRRPLRNNRYVQNH